MRSGCGTDLGDVDEVFEVHFYKPRLEEEALVEEGRDGVADVGDEQLAVRLQRHDPAASVFGNAPYDSERGM